MKNTITQLKAERARRPKEQHIKVDVRKLDELLKGVEDQQIQLFKLENENRKLRAQLEA